MNIEKQQIKQPSQITNLLTTIALSISTITGCQCIKDKSTQNINRIPTNRRQAEQTGVLLITYSIECLLDELFRNQRCVEVNDQEFCFDNTDGAIDKIARLSSSFYGVVSVQRDPRFSNMYHIKLTETSYRTINTLNKISNLSRRFNIQVNLNHRTNTLTISK